MELYYTFSRYLKEQFGEPVRRISLDAGFGCPNEPACIYCDNQSFGIQASSGKPLTAQIKESMDYYRKKRKINSFIAYFQSFSNTYGEIKQLKTAYDMVRGFPEIKALFISTRPDCIDQKKLELIAGYQRDYLVWIEYGLQSTSNSQLKKLGRGHSYEDFLAALTLTRKYGINIGVHMILGLPGQTREVISAEAKKISALDIQGVKFHILHAIKNTELAGRHSRGEVSFLSRNEYVNYVCDFLELLPPEVIILRLVSDARPGYLIAPLWMKDKHKVIEDIREELKKRGTYQGAKYVSDSL